MYFSNLSGPYLQSSKKENLFFEIETIAAIGQSQGCWKGRWVNREDGSKIVINTLSCFNELSRIETILCRYEAWEKNHITQTEVEDFRLKLYEPLEIEQLLAL